MEKNRRKFKRVNCEYEVVHSLTEWNSLFHESSDLAKTINISACGVLIETLKQYKQGDLISLKFEIPEWEKIKNHFLKNHLDLSKTLNVIGKVIRIDNFNNKYNAGIEYQLIDEKHQEAISSYFNLLSERTN